MIEFVAGAFLIGVLIFSLIQLAFLWAGQGAVETAAHFAARKFALNARTDLRTARTAALAEAASLCKNRPGGRWEGANITSIRFSLEGKEENAARAQAGEAYKVLLTHGVELTVPWVDRILFLLAPVPKTRIGEKYYLYLRAIRWVTVE